MQNLVTATQMVTNREGLCSLSPGVSGQALELGVAQVVVSKWCWGLEFRVT
jgi:hypothetical protein